MNAALAIKQAPMSAHDWLLQARESVQRLYPDASLSDQAMLAAALVDASAREFQATVQMHAADQLAVGLDCLAERIGELARGQHGHA